MGRVVLQKTQALCDVDRFSFVVLVIASRVYLRGAESHTTRPPAEVVGNDSHFDGVVIDGGVATVGIVNSV